MCMLHLVHGALLILGISGSALPGLGACEVSQPSIAGGPIQPSSRW